MSEFPVLQTYHAQHDPIFFRQVEFSRLNFWLAALCNQLISPRKPAPGEPYPQWPLADAPLKYSCSPASGIEQFSLNLVYFSLSLLFGRPCRTFLVQLDSWMGCFHELWRSRCLSPTIFYDGHIQGFFSSPGFCLFLVTFLT